MLEDKKLLYISKPQRVVVTSVLLLISLAAGGLVYFAAVTPAYEALLLPAVELLKLLLAGTAAWGLIILYASANSATRITKETDRFFSHDVLDAFERSGFRQTEKGAGRKAILIKNSGGSAIFQTSIDANEVCYLWCRLNVNQLSIVFLLNPSIAENYESIFQASLKGFLAQGVTVQCFGIQTHDADGALGKPRTFFELYVRKKLENDFLFDAASRYSTANGVVGDALSFAIELSRISDAA